MSLSEFFAMGGYGAYVWPSYVVTLLVLVGNIYLARSAHRRAIDDALRRAAREESKS